GMGHLFLCDLCGSGFVCGSFVIAPRIRMNPRKSVASKLISPRSLRFELLIFFAGNPRAKDFNRKGRREFAEHAEKDYSLRHVRPMRSLPLPGFGFPLAFLGDLCGSRVCLNSRESA